MYAICRLALCLLFLLSGLKSKTICKKGPVYVEDHTSDVCLLSTNFTVDPKESVILIMNSTNRKVVPTLLRLKISQNFTFSTCIRTNGTEEKNGQSFLKFTDTWNILNRPIVFSISFNEVTDKSWTSSWSIDEDKRQRDNECDLNVKENGKYLEIYFESNTTYTVHAAIKCTKQ